MDLELQEKCNVILDDDAVLEEDKIERVEEIVQEMYNGLSSSDIERMVLDILWRHRDEESRDHVSKHRAKVIERKPATFVQATETPLPSDFTKLEPKKDLLPPAPPQDDDEKAEEVSWEDWDTSNPFDILRQVLGAENSDEDIKHALEKNNYDLGATMGILMEETNNNDDQNTTAVPSQQGVDNYDEEPFTEKTLCKYFLQYQECLRADCKYSHDLSGRICRFWLQGSCLAGETCAFLHYIPEPMVEKLSISENSPSSSDTTTINQQQPPGSQRAPVKLTEDEFPALGQAKNKNSKKPPPPSAPLVFNPNKSFIPGSGTSFTSTPATVKPLPQFKRRLNRKVVNISEPRLVPWIATDFEDNEAYLDHRNTAAKHAELRNKYLQLAARSWHQNNPSQARLLSTKGQKHNDQMIDEYFAGSELLFEQRKKPDSEIFIDLHGMELEESIERLEEVLKQIESEEKKLPRPVYSICGIGHHHSRNSASEDKLSKKVKEYLDKKGYEWKEFKTKEYRYGKFIGIDPWSHR